MTHDQELELGKLYRALQENQPSPIEPGHPYYVRIWEDSPYDPVQQLRKHILWSEVESLQLFSGFSGAGKSTQLRRLKKELEGTGDYFVIYANAENYVNLGEAADITDLLLVVAGAFSDGLQEADTNLVAESYWTRFLNYLAKTKVEITEAGVKLDPVELKASLRTTPSFRQRVQEQLAGRLNELRKDVQLFVEEGVKKVEAKQNKKVVFLFDSLEKIRGTPSNADQIMDSLERLFRTHLELLKLPYVHCVYSVPAWLKFIKPDAPIVLIPSIRQWNNDLPRSPYEPGWGILRSVMKTRLKAAGCELLFGPPDATGKHAQAERLIENSGGALRDMLRLFGTAIREARALPVPTEDITRAIGIVRNDFKTNIEDAHWLDKIGRERAADPPTGEKSDLHRLMRLLESHFVLYFRNEDDWYDMHPLVRADVQRIVDLNPAQTQTA